MEDMSVFKILTGKPTRNTPLGRTRRRWEDIIIIDLKTNTRNSIDWAQYRDYWNVYYECGIKSAGSISHGVSWLKADKSTSIATHCSTYFILFTSEYKRFNITL